MAVIRQVINLPGENVRVLVEGMSRGIVTDYREEENYSAVQVRLHKDRIVRSNDGKALVRTTQDLFETYARTSQRVSEEMVEGLRKIEKPGEIADLLSVPAGTVNSQIHSSPS